MLPVSRARQKALAFLLPLGFRLESEHEGTSASFKDGFEIIYVSRELTVKVAYGDMQFEVDFKKGKITVPCLFLDQPLHANASGLAGTMFPFDKLVPVIDRVAEDIEATYGAVLQGDAAAWQKIEKLVSVPKEKKSFLP